MIDVPRWQSLLYGRTLRADRWWRVRPHRVDVEWLNSLVLAAVSGGEGLSDGPRFLLCRDARGLLVGVACRAADLHDTMNSDGSRPLYCCVGWYSRDPWAAAPTWENLTRNWQMWAAEVYQRWMLVDWDKHRTELGDGHESPSDPAPWVEAVPATPMPEASAAPAEAWMLPEGNPGGPVEILHSDAAAAWAALLARRRPFAFVGYFRQPPTTARQVLSHLGVTELRDGSDIVNDGQEPARTAPPGNAPREPDRSPRQPQVPGRSEPGPKSPAPPLAPGRPPGGGRWLASHLRGLMDRVAPAYDYPAEEAGQHDSDRPEDPAGPAPTGPQATLEYLRQHPEEKPRS